MTLPKGMLQAGNSIFGGSGIKRDVTEFDTSETLEIGASCLLSMLKHGRAGVPLEVMGLMLGKHVDKYTIRLSQVFAMPQSGTGVNVDAIDHPFQVNMTTLIEQVNRNPISIGWYHSHPGFGCWLSNVDISTHQAFEKIDPRAIAVVIDPIQSVKGKVIIDAFRSFEASIFISSKNSRLITSTSHYEEKPTITALMRGLNRYYYSVKIKYRVTDLEKKMLERLVRKSWTDRLQINFNNHKEDVINGEFDFEDIKGKHTENKAKKQLEEIQNEEFGKTFKKELMEEQKIRKIEIFKKEVEDIEKYEIKINKEIKYVKEYLENKIRNEKSSKHFEKDFGFDSDKNKENEDKKENEKDEKISKEEHFEEALKNVKLSRVGNVNYLKQLSIKIRKLYEVKAKELLEYSRISSVFGNCSARKIYTELVNEYK